MSRFKISEKINERNEQDLWTIDRAYYGHERVRILTHLWLDWYVLSPKKIIFNFMVLIQNTKSKYFLRKICGYEKCRMKRIC